MGDLKKLNSIMISPIASLMMKGIKIFAIPRRTG